MSATTMRAPELLHLSETSCTGFMACGLFGLFNPTAIFCKVQFVSKLRGPDNYLVITFQWATLHSLEAFQASVNDCPQVLDKVVHQVQADKPNPN